MLRKGDESPDVMAHGLFLHGLFFSQNPWTMSLFASYGGHFTDYFAKIIRGQDRGSSSRGLSILRA